MHFARLFVTLQSSMKIQDLLQLYAKSPQAGALAKVLEDSSVKSVFLQGLVASSAPVLFASVADRCRQTVLFVLQDADEAGYFYHDLTQMLGKERVFFFPSSYRRQVKYAQRDAANEILRTEVLGMLSSTVDNGELMAQSASPLYVVTHPEALSELVVSKQKLDERTIVLKKGQTTDVTELEHSLRELGFHEVDYVYEPGQFAVRGSIVDVYSYSSEYPFRIDFFGDDIDSIRTFEVQNQLSRDKRQQIEIVPELTTMGDERSALCARCHRPHLPRRVLVAGPDRAHGGSHRDGAACHDDADEEREHAGKWFSVYR